MRARAQLAEVYELDPVRFEVMLHFGAFVTESSGHFSEYVPYFRKRPELIERYGREGYLGGGTGFYTNNWPTWRADNEKQINEMLSGTREIPYQRSHEYGSFIIEAVTLHRPGVIYGNVRNTGLIDNLSDGCVEVACLVDRHGIRPIHFGSLSEQLAALNRAHMAVHQLVVQALLAREKEAARYAFLLDPLTKIVSTQTVQHVFLNQDSDLIDVNLSTTRPIAPPDTNLALCTGKWRWPVPFPSTEGR